MSLSRRGVLAMGFVAVLATTAFVALPYLDAALFIVRAAQMPGAVAAVAGWRGHALAAAQDLQVPTRRGAIPGRLYAPADGFTRTVMLTPGVHRDGIDEARLVGLARDLAATGVGVVTVAAPDLQQFRITPGVTDVIEDAALWVAAQPSLAPDGRLGLVGISFSGGLSIVAAGRAPLNNKVRFVLSFGGHGDLARVMHYLCSGQVEGDIALARASRMVAGADHVQVHPPHDYGVAVVLLTLADRMVPPEQVGPLAEGINGFLLASSLDMLDKPRATAEFARVRAYADTLPEPARTLMTLVNDRAVDKLGPLLLPLADALRDHPAMPALSPERAAPPTAPVFLLHGTDDNVIPAIETVLLAEHLDGLVPVRGLLSGLITHAEVNRTATTMEIWRLASFWRQVLTL